MPQPLSQMSRDLCCIWHILVALLLLPTTAVVAAPPGELAARIAAARLDAGADPQRALAALRSLRGETQAQSLLDLRLAVDEAECRVLTDVDSSQAIAVADAGLAASGADPEGTLREPWLRLRTCRAGMLVQAGDAAAGRVEFEALLALTEKPADANVHALALMERGVHRSRMGNWDLAQSDLIASCEQLRNQGSAVDHALCLGHLANHYRRVGDADEALRLFQTLNTAARQRGATFDSAIYSFGIGQSQQAQQRWADAILNFEEAGLASKEIGDAIGVSYATHAIALSHLNLGRAQAALDHAERALAQLDRVADPRQYEVNVVTRAQALAALNRAAEANAELERIEPAVRKRGEQPSLASWLSVRASVMRQLGRWREAYLALSQEQEIQARLQDLRVSQQSARLRMQFNRARDAEAISALSQLNERGMRLRETQAVALGLFIVLLVGVVFVAVRKFRQARLLQNLASTDELTGLINRRALIAFAADALTRAHQDRAALAMLMIDIDNFKRINDSYGHAVGDQVLCHVARVLAAGLRDRDRLGRVGGEEFVAVLPDATLDQARLVAERMRMAIDATRMIGPSGEVRFTVSIGVAGAQIAETVSAVMGRADAALYRAKNDGRNRVVVDAAEALPLGAA